MRKRNPCDFGIIEDDIKTSCDMMRMMFKLQHYIAGGVLSFFKSLGGADNE